MVVGMALGAAGYALFVPVGLGSDYVVSMLPTMVLIGLGFTLVYGPLTIVATDGVEAGEQGLASGLFNTAFQFGAAIGLAVVAAVVASAGDAGGDPQATLDGYRIGLLVPVAGAFAGAGRHVAGPAQQVRDRLTRRIVCRSGRNGRCAPDFVHAIVSRIRLETTANLHADRGHAFGRHPRRASEPSPMDGGGACDGSSSSACWQ